MNDEQLIELVRHYSVIYDLSHPKYMNSSFKYDIWTKIGKEMKVDGSSCKTRWNNIRDNYRKSLKRTATKSRQSAKKMKVYKYTEQLIFLKKYFDERETKGNIDIQNDIEENQDFGAQEDTDEDRWDDVKETTELKLNANLHSQSSNRKNIAAESIIGKSSTKKGTPQQTASATLLEFLISKRENLAPTTSSRHPIDAFLDGIAPTLKTFPAYYLNVAKSEIFATVQKYEMKLLAEQHSYEGKCDPNFIRNTTPSSRHYSTSSSPASTPNPTSQD